MIYLFQDDASGLENKQRFGVCADQTLSTVRSLISGSEKYRTTVAHQNALNYEILELVTYRSSLPRILSGGAETTPKPKERPLKK
jgi:hypothetical protein